MDSARAAPQDLERERWERAIAPLLAAGDETLWRAHCDAVNAQWLERRLPATAWGRLLKTDLWDEAAGEGLYRLLAAHAGCIAGIDFVPAVLAAAGARHPRLLGVLADVRRLPFEDGAFDAVVSTSTLDHFAAHDDIAVALRELHRVLGRGGRLLLTLDNRANPAIAARNAFPYALLRRAGLVPYPVGATCGPRRLRRMVEHCGFEVLETTALLHCPRVLAVAAARRLQRAGAAAGARFLARLRNWEALARLPTRYLTGYFTAVDARKR